MFSSYIKSCSYYLPEKIVTNDELAKTLDTSHEWIVSRTGINQRHIAGDHETASFMGAECAKKVIGQEGVDLIIVATCTADHIMPSTASLIQSALGLNCAAFDVQGACAGFIYALSIGDQFIKTGMYERVLVIGVEKMSKVLDWTDRGTCVLFGDGAGAVLLERASDETSKIIDFNLFSDGAKKDLVYVDDVLKMRGTELFRQAVDKLGSCVEAILTKHNLSADDIDWFIPHQANLRIIQFLSERFKIPMEKMIVNIDECANTSAASIPIALGRAYEKGQIKRGQKILLEAIGSGLVWGSVLLDF
jgi:3-oxoacyl-[acyl-carrier-protein] synthase-3